MINDSDYRRLARYFAGECSVEERQATDAWLDADAARRADAERLRRLWVASARGPWKPDTQAAWNNLLARVNADGGPALTLVSSAHHEPARRFQWRAPAPTLRWPMMVGAVLAAAVAIAFIAESEQVRAVDRVQALEASRPVEHEFRTARGQRGVVVLGDGSRVELGPESMLRVRDVDSAGRRVVALDGQAVFDVVHDTLHPFEVRSRNAIAEDIGTRFGMRAYRGERRVQVFVASGSVALRAVGAPGNSGTLLGPRDLGTLDSLGRATVRNGVDSAAHLAWTHDRFVFENAPVEDVLADIARTYAVAINVADPTIRHRRITMNVQARSLTDVLGAVTTPLHLRSTRRGSTILIR